MNQQSSSVRVFVTAALALGLCRCGGGSDSNGGGGTTGTDGGTSHPTGSTGTDSGASHPTGSTGTDGGVVSSSGGDDGGGSPGAPVSTDSGVLVPGLPSHLLIGWGENPDESWAAQSGVKFDLQWCYLTGRAGNNWYNGYGYSPADGSWLDGALSEVDARGFIPGYHYYYLGSLDSSGGSDLLTEAQDVPTMTEYFAELKSFMQHVKSFGKPVMVLFEGDFFGQLSLLSAVKGNSGTTAAVASTGMAELAGLPNTIAGIGLAYLTLRKSVGATNLYMGIDTPYYAAGGDIMNFGPQDTDPLPAHVSTLFSYFGPIGYDTNPTGVKFDYSAGSPRAADQGYYTTKASPSYDGRDAWSPSDSASVNSPSVNRYVSYLSLYHQKTGVPWLLHQVPIGNSQHTNTTYSANTARSGYQDVLAEYLFQTESPASTAIRTQHLANFANAGVVAMLFGFSDDGDQPTNDLWLDNQPFFSTHVDALVKAGGFGL